MMRRNSFQAKPRLISWRALAALVFSAMLVLASLGVFLISGLNLGIDFKGGILLEGAAPQAADVSGCAVILNNSSSVTSICRNLALRQIF